MLTSFDSSTWLRAQKEEAAARKAIASVNQVRHCQGEGGSSGGQKATTQLIDLWDRRPAERGVDGYSPLLRLVQLTKHVLRSMLSKACGITFRSVFTSRRATAACPLRFCHVP